MAKPQTFWGHHLLHDMVSTSMQELVTRISQVGRRPKRWDDWFNDFWVHLWLVGGDWLPSILFSQKYWECLIIPIHELIFFRGVETTTTNQMVYGTQKSTKPW